MAAPHPTGTVTFLFTDIEGSTRRWERDRPVMAEALARHDQLLRAAIEGHGGYVFKTVGDAFCAAFADAAAALDGAIAAQRALAREPWDAALGPLRVRMALHTGTAEERGADYFGPAVNRVARLLSTGAGQQILLSRAAADAVRARLPEGCSLLDLGGHRLKDLARPEHVFQLAAPDLPRDFPPLKSLDAQPNNLPIQPTPIVGREDAVQEVVDLLRREDRSEGARLLTLTGPGGVGKTRLALQAAAELIDAFPNGVWFVDLSALRESALVVPEIARTLGVREEGNEPIRDRLAETLRDERALLVLDNLEQVTAAAADIAVLLAACPKLKVLATSRVVLQLREERELAVPPLAVPDPRDLPAATTLAAVPAVRLFAARAGQVAPGFAVTDANAAAVAGICARLEGLPLALELAAAWSGVLAPAEMLGQLERRLDLLGEGAADLPARQRTMRNAIAWSVDLLRPEDQALFAELAVFAGGCTAAAARAVGGNGGSPLALLGGLRRLAQGSLLRREGEGEGSARFRMLETIREHGLERLAASGEAAAVRRRHAAWSLALAEEAKPKMTGPEQGAWLERLETEHDNLRAAMGSALECGEAELALRLAGALERFWTVRCHLTEGRRWLDTALAADAAAGSAARLAALTGSGALAQAQGDYAQATARFEEGLAIAERCGDREATAVLLNSLGGVALERGELDRADALYGQSLALSAELGDRRRYASALGNLGAVAHYRGDLATAAERYEASLATRRRLGDKAGSATVLFNLLALLAHSPAEQARAQAYGEESLRLSRELGDRQGVAFALTGLAFVAEVAGELDRAAALHEESLALFREIDDRGGVARALGNLGLVVHERGDHEQGLALCCGSLRLFAELGELDGVAIALEAAAAILAGHGDPVRATRLFGAAEALRERIGVASPPESRRRHELSEADLHRRLGADRFRLAWSEGRTQSIEQATAEALGGPSRAVRIDASPDHDVVPVEGGAAPARAATSRP